MCEAIGTFGVEKTKTLAAIALALWVAIGVFAPDHVFAQEDPFETLNEAEINALIELLEGAREEESNRNWSEALDLYRAAAAIAPLDEYAYRQAVCLERLEHYREAMDLFLELSETGTPEVAESASDRLVELESVIAAIPVRLSISSEPVGATVWIDGVEVDETTEQGLTVDVLPGSYDVRLTLFGYNDWTQDIDVEPLADHSHSVSMVLLTPPSDPNPLPYVFLGSSGAFLTVGVIMNLLSQDRASEHNDRPPGGDVSLLDSQALADDAEGLFRLAVGGYIIAGILFGTAVVTYFVLDDSPSDDGSEVMIVPAVSDDGAGAVVLWEF